MKLSQPVAFALASLVQLGIFYGLYLGLSQAATVPPSLSVVSAQLITESPSEEVTPETTPPKPKPVTEKAVVPVSRPQLLHVPAAAPTPSETAPTAVVTQQAEKPADPASSTDAPVMAATTSPLQLPPPTPPRFDADYLNNPLPIYPALSRRLNEHGTVRLRVRVNADGSVAEVQLQRSSGFSRLDDAALKAVASWRFVPARQGTEAVAGWVVVPMPFELN